MEQYMSIGDAAKALGVVPATVKLMLRSGRLTPAARTVGGIYLFDLADIDRLVQERASRPPSVSEGGAQSTKLEEIDG